MDAVRLCPLRESDLPATLAWRNAPQVRPWFKTTDPIAWDTHVAWFRANQDNPDDKVFVVERIADSVAVGQVSVYRIDRTVGEAEIGRFVANPDFSGRGYMKQACRLLIDFAFSELKLQKLYLEVRAHNARAIGLYRALGFLPVSSLNGLIRFEMKVDNWHG